MKAYWLQKPDAEDIMQDVMTSLWQSEASTLKAGEDLEPSVTSARIVDAIRRALSSRRRLAAGSIGDVVDQANELETLVELEEVRSRANSIRKRLLELTAPESDERKVVDRFLLMCERGEWPVSLLRIGRELGFHRPQKACDIWHSLNVQLDKIEDQ